MSKLVWLVALFQQCSKCVTTPIFSSNTPSFATSSRVKYFCWFFCFAVQFLFHDQNRKMRASFVCVATALLAVSHGHGFRSELCHDLRSSQHAFRQWCWKNDNDGHEKEQYQFNSSQLTLTRQTNSPYPWSYDPFCVFSKSLEIDICAWTDAHFANGRGISIIATPESATAVAMNKIFRDPDLAKTANGVFTPPYEIRQLPGRGLGLIANRTVKRGEKIFAHTPIVVAQAISETGLYEEDLFELHRIAVERLPKRSRDLFLALHGHFGGDPIYDRFGTNAFNVFDFAAIFPETAVCSLLIKPFSY